MKIGYQGDIFSNNELAAKKYFENTDNCEFLPLVSSKNVVNELLKEKINYGVMALFNSSTGVIPESTEALKNANVTCIGKISLPIHHCLFTLEETENKDIKLIISHIQAFKQCENYLNENRKFCLQILSSDQALAAKKLSLKMYDYNSAVICKKEAGEFYNLKLIEENIEDNKNNATTFGIFVKK